MGSTAQPISVIKGPDIKQRTEGRACLGLQVQRILAWSCVLVQKHHRYVVEGAYAYPSRQEAGNKTGSDQG